MTEKPNIIIDTGTKYTKAGFSNEDAPFIFPTSVGHHKYERLPCGKDIREFYVGDQVEDMIGILKEVYPIKYGVIENWDDIEKIWCYIFDSLLKVSSESTVILTESPINTKVKRKKIVTIMFEEFGVKALNITNQSTLSLLSTGKYTGTVIDSGEDITNIVPIFDGYALHRSILSSKLGGNDIDNYIFSSLSSIDKLRISLSERKIKKIARDIKEKFCYTALDFKEEMKTIKEISYVLPDKQIIKIKEEILKGPEIFFKPELHGKYFYLSVDEECTESINKTDIELRKDLYNNIVLSGGNTMFKGLTERFTKEIKHLAPESMKNNVNVTNAPEGQYSAWLGATILSSLSTFNGLLIKRDEYQEEGTSIIRKKWI